MFYWHLCAAVNVNLHFLRNETWAPSETHWNLRSSAAAPVYVAADFIKDKSQKGFWVHLPAILSGLSDSSSSTFPSSGKRGSKKKKKRSTAGWLLWSWHAELTFFQQEFRKVDRLFSHTLIWKGCKYLRWHSQGPLLRRRGCVRPRGLCETGAGRRPDDWPSGCFYHNTPPEARQSQHV